ncbi:MAG: helix-turn-helix transcriptional regulator [Bacteroidota bacterium]
MKIDRTKLRKFRERNHLSQAEFAESIGLSQATIWEWEQKDSDVKLEYFTKLIDVYGNEVNDLSKDGTIININNQHNNKIGNNAIARFDLRLDVIAIQKEHIDNLKSDNEFFKSNINVLLEKLTDLIDRIEK